MLALEVYILIFVFLCTFLLNAFFSLVSLCYVNGNQAIWHNILIGYTTLSEFAARVYLAVEQMHSIWKAWPYGMLFTDGFECYELTWKELCLLTFFRKFQCKVCWFYANFCVRKMNFLISIFVNEIWQCYVWFLLLLTVLWIQVSIWQYRPKCQLQGTISLDKFNNG